MQFCQFCMQENQSQEEKIVRWKSVQVERQKGRVQVRGKTLQPGTWAVQKEVHWFRGEK